MPEKVKKKLTEILFNQRTLAIAMIVVIFGVIAYFTVRDFEDIFLEDTESATAGKTLRINEYVTRNANTLRDEYWNSPDWIEIYNYGTEDVWLGDVYLSDSLDDPGKFQLPDEYLAAGEYLLVLASDRADYSGEYLEASFKIGENDENLLLYCDGVVIDSIDIDFLPEDISAGYGTLGGFGYFASPTPGAANTTQIYDSYNIEPENTYEGILLINEYMTDNLFAYEDSYGNTYDWVEIYNPGEEEIFLGDIYISDDDTSPNEYCLPDVYLEAGGYYIVYCAGGVMDGEDEPYATFKLSGAESSIVLTYKSGYTIDTCTVESLATDTSAGYSEDGVFGYFVSPTPGAANDTEISDTPDIEALRDSEAPILLNEWMPGNKYGLLDADGDASDWIEIYNPTEEEFSMDGFALTDDSEDLFKWEFPDGVTIAPQGYLLIFASGKDKADEDELHTNFSLSKDETLYIIDSDSAVVDSAVMEDLPGNVSKGRADIGYGYFSSPTPGEKNTTACRTSLCDGVDFIPGELYISEVGTGDLNYIRSSSGGLEEYIELYNSGDTEINLNGYSIYEVGKEAYFFDDVIIYPHRYILLALDGSSYGYSDAIEVDNMSLDSAGEKLVLESADGEIIDYFSTGYLLGSYSSGRTDDGEGKRYFFMEKTPGEKNSDMVYTGYADMPVFSVEGGMCGDAFYLTITAKEDAIIYYTLNGNIPTDESTQYTEPIYIESDTVVRAVAVTEGELPSQIETNTYILDRQHEIPVVCLTGPPAYLFYDATGIYSNGEGYEVGEYPYFSSNYFKDWESPIAFEYYDESGAKALEFDAGLQVAGGYTRALAQKSLVVRLRDEYGLSEVSYPFFEEGETEFCHIYLRNGGQDGWQTKIRDMFTQNAMAQLGTVDTKRGTPVAVYINGEYWGMYNLRDKLNSDYLAIKYDISEDSVNILTEYSSPKVGSAEDWNELREFCRTHNMSLQENYDYLVSQIDLVAFTDYIIGETFFGNVDTHNINFWMSEEADGLWRPLMFDLDLSVRGVDYSHVDDYLGSNYLGFHAEVIKSLAKNDEFKTILLERYAYILGNVFTEEYFNSELDALEDEIRTEMEYQVDRWGRPSSMEFWQECMDFFREEVLFRRHEAVEELKEFFELDDEYIDELFPWYDEDYS